MIEIVKGTIEERIIRVLQKIYPITVKDLQDELHLSKNSVLRFLNKLKTKGVIQLEPLPDKTYIRLLRNDFSFIGKKHQRKFIKHSSEKKKNEEYNGMMYS
jgi:predicted ArsR family transcriptional regulator